VGYPTNSQKLGVGDPFVHTFIGTVLRGAGGLIGGLPGKIATTAGGIIGGQIGQGAQPVDATIITQTVPEPTGFPGGFMGGATGTGIKKTGQRQPGRVKGVAKRRRMNPLNVKALRRSTRRLASFQREAKKVEKELRKLAPPARRRSSRRDLGAHHTHVR